MRIKAYGKINWFLNIVGKTDNGYHLLDMLMESVDVYDVIEIKESVSTGIYIKANNEFILSSNNNLCIKALNIYKNFTMLNKNYTIYLEKNIPVGAGMGGGSADAAAMLIALNIINNTKISEFDLQKLGLKIGADVPFILKGGFAQVSGIGEKVLPLYKENTANILVIYNDNILSTQSVFSKFNFIHNTFGDINMSKEAIIRSEYKKLQEYSNNSLLQPAINLNGEISLAIESLYLYNAEFAIMTGSGSAVFGVFKNEKNLETAYNALTKIYKKCLVCKTIKNSIEIV